MDRRLRRLTRRPSGKLRTTRRPARTEALRYVFIVTYGRSGSTLLLGVLNSLPGYLLRGENGDAVRHLFQFHQTAATEHKRHGQSSDGSTNPFFGIGGYPANRSRALIRRLVTETLLRPEEDTRVTGFKEIRWRGPDLQEYVVFLQRVFPGARFVINTRNHADVAKSKWWAGMETAESTLESIEKRMLATAERLGDAAYHVHYDDYIADPAVLRGLIEWLGEEYDAAVVAEVLDVRHST